MACSSAWPSWPWSWHHKKELGSKRKNWVMAFSFIAFVDYTEATIGGFLFFLYTINYTSSYLRFDFGDCDIACVHLNCSPTSVPSTRFVCVFYVSYDRFMIFMILRFTFYVYIFLYVSLYIKKLFQFVFIVLCFCLLFGLGSMFLKFFK